MSYLLIALALTVPAPRDKEPAPRTLRVLSYNIHHGRGTDDKVDLPRLAGLIKATNPDLVALQEVDHKTKRTGGVDQTAELAKLTGLRGKFAKAIDFQGGEYGQAVLSRFPLGELKVHLLPDKPGQEQRIAAEARLKIDGRELTFVTTHLDHVNGKLREQQAARLNELFVSTDRPVILAGDLNATPESKPMGLLLARWTNATDDKKLLTIPAVKPTRQIDYVLCKPKGRFRVVERKVIEEKIASDHRPVFVVLEFRGG